MMEHWELLLAVVGFAAVFWAQAKRFVEWTKSWVVVTKKLDHYTARLMLSFFDATMRRSTQVGGAYGSSMVFVRPLERIYRVVFQVLHGSRQTFWRRRRPIWFHVESVDRNEASSSRADYHMSFSYLRGTYDWEKLLLQAADWEDSNKVGTTKQSSRFRVVYHYGSGGLGEHLDRVGKNAASLDAPTEHWHGVAAGSRILRWSQEDVQGAALVSSMDSLSLREELLTLVDELKFWHDSQAWYQQHGIPWRRGIIMHGGPGSGKTSFTRALAELLDLPVHVFDLAGMSNQDLRRSWREMLQTVPCIALIEDIDAVFEGRKNIAPQGMMGGGGLTFDTLLNCLDGIERVDGVLNVISTNRLDTIDEALHDRPGRVDRIVEFRPLDHAGRMKMALRILEDQDLAAKMAAAHADDSAARFQERCFQVALRRRFRESA